MRLLSLKQILADVGAFCEGYAKAVSTALGPGALLPTRQGWAPPPSRWVVVGGSYAGALAAWSAARHPSLVAGAIASSAVVAPALEVPEFDLSPPAIAGTPCAAAMRAVSRALDADEYSLAFLSETAAHPRKSARQWLWQRCSSSGSGRRRRRGCRSARRS